MQNLIFKGLNSQFKIVAATQYITRIKDSTNKHSDECIYLPPYKLDVLKTVEYKFSCELEAHVEVTTSLMFDCNTFKDKMHLLILVAITLPSKELQFCNFAMW